MRPKAKRSIAAAVTVAVVGLWWFFFGYYRDVNSRIWKWLTESFLERQLFPNGWNVFAASPLFYLLLAIAAGVLTCLFWPRLEITRGEYDTSTNTRAEDTTQHYGSRKAVIGLAALTIFSTVQFTHGFWNNDKDGARSYAGAAVFAVQNPAEPPSSLRPLVEGASEGNNGCELVGSHDVFGCVVTGDLPSGWEARSASATGANIVMSRSSGIDTNTTLLNNTLTYLYNQDGSGAWTAIRDGINRQPVHGVVSWDGAQPVQTCRFEDDYALDKAFGGLWGANLHDEIANQYRNLLYDTGDMWGYCRKAKTPDAPSEPIIVIPVTKQEGYAMRTTLRPAGVLVIKGSPSGSPKIIHVEQIEPGDYPGPVYALSLVAQQRDTLQWAAGRANRDRLQFGFEPTDVETQTGNTSEYLLRSVDDGRLYWVTPLKPRSSDSQQLLAYSVTPADAVSSGELNQQRVYVLDGGDPRVINLDEMEARVSQAIRSRDPGFFTGTPNSAPGRILEFLPLDDTTWQVYAELGGRVVYRIEVPSDARVQPTVTNLDDFQGGTEQPLPGAPVAPSVDGCAGPPTELSDGELAQCIGNLADELQRRQAPPN